MIPTEDNYADGTTSTTEYEPRTWCMATVKILGESSRAMNGSTVPTWSKSRFADWCKRSCFLAGIAGVSLASL